MKHILLVSLLGAFAVSLHAEAVKSLSDFQAAAEKANEILVIPDWPKTPEEVQNNINTTIAKADAALGVIGKQDLSKVTFASTVGALDDIQNDATIAINKTVVIQQTNQDAAMRDAAEKAIKVFQDWAVGIDYREDVYKAVKAYADTNPKLEGEDELLLEHTMRDYRRAGLALPPEKRAEVEKLRKELAKLETDFEANIVAVKAPVTFTKEELEGVPDSVLESPGVKTGDDTYTIMANVTFQYNTVEDTAKKEETRKHLNEVRFNLAREKNVPVLNDMLAHRNQIALKLGYKSWDDFQTEIKMAKTGAAAKTFINDLIAGIQPKFDAEVAELRKLKVAETKDPNAQINIWDWRYFQNELKKEKYTVDTEALRVYFPFQRTLEGMFNIYQSIFGLKFTKIIAPEKWVNDLQLYMVTDAASGQPLGMFYLDMFPREGKFNHFAEFGIVPGKLLPDGKYQRPTVALLCNFPPPQKDKPSLLSHRRCRDPFPRIRPRSPLHRDDCEVCPLLRDQRAGRLCRGALANAAKLGLEQEGARHLRGRLSKSVEENSRRDNRENEGSKARDRRCLLSATVRLCRHRSRLARRSSGGATLRLRGDVEPDSAKGLPAN